MPHFPELLEAWQIAHRARTLALNRWYDAAMDVPADKVLVDGLAEDAAARCDIEQELWSALDSICDRAELRRLGPGPMSWTAAANDA